VLCAARKHSTAHDELELLCGLVPSATEELRREIEHHIASVSEDEDAAQEADLWSSEVEAAVAEAIALIKEWKIPVTSSLEDFSLIDDFINRYAPAGDFMAVGDFARLHEVGNASVGRAFSLHLGAVMVSAGLASWHAAEGGALTLQSKRGLRIPIESFVHERLILGASGDNFSSLESLVAEISSSAGDISSRSAERDSWWRAASEEEVRHFKEQAEWARGVLQSLGADLRGALQDLEEIDRRIESCFEPGGVVQEVAKPILKDEVERFVVGLGLLVGEIVSQHLSCVWYAHELPEGFSLKAQEIGRLYPVAQLQRRVYLSSAADPTAKLGSFAFGIAAAVISQRVRSGIYADRPHVMTAFKELLPRVAEFSEAELEGVVDSIFKRSRPTEV